MHEPVARILLLGSELTEYRRLEEMLSSIQAPSYQLLWSEQLHTTAAEIASGNYDVILLQCQDRPDIALELLKSTIEQGCRIPIIAITDSVDSSVAQQALNYGATDFLAMENLDSYLLKRCIGYAVNKRDVDKKLSQLNLYDRVLFRSPACTRAPGR